MEQTKLRLTVEQIVEETIAYIEKHGRATTAQGDCVYLTDDGKQCALGRCMDMRRFRPVFNEGGPDEIQEHFGELDKALKERYRGYPKEFWYHLMDLHDNQRHWFSDGELTEAGDNHRDYIIEKFGA